MERDRSIGQELARSIASGRDRDRGMSRQVTLEGDIPESDDPAEAFDRLVDSRNCELALLRRTVEGLAAERPPAYTEMLGAMDTATARISAIGQILAKVPPPAMTPERMAQRIAAAGSAAGDRIVTADRAAL